LSAPLSEHCRPDRVDTVTTVATATDCHPWFRHRTALRPTPCTAIKGERRTRVSPFSPLSPPRHRALTVHSALLSLPLPCPPSAGSSPTGVPRTALPLKPCAPPTGDATLITARVGPHPRATLRRAAIRFCHEGVTGTSLLQPPTRSIDAAPSTARVPTTFLSHEPPTSTTGRHPSPSFPSGRATPLRTLPSSEPPLSPVAKSSPPPHRPSRPPTAPPHCVAAHRNRRRRRAPRLPSFDLGPKGAVGWARKVMAKRAWPIPTVPFRFFFQN
jgi:hypothetical protein